MHAKSAFTAEQRRVQILETATGLFAKNGFSGTTSAALARVMASLPERPGHRPTPQPTADQLGDCGWVANRWCELLPVPQELKQQLMQLDNPLVRLELVADVLDRTGIARA